MTIARKHGASRTRCQEYFAPVNLQWSGWRGDLTRVHRYATATCKSGFALLAANNSLAVVWWKKSASFPLSCGESLSTSNKLSLAGWQSDNHVFRHLIQDVLQVVIHCKLDLFFFTIVNGYAKIINPSASKNTKKLKQQLWPNPSWIEGMFIYNRTDVYPSAWVQECVRDSRYIGCHVWGFCGNSGVMNIVTSVNVAFSKIVKDKKVINMWLRIDERWYAIYTWCKWSTYIIAPPLSCQHVCHYLL